MKLVQATGINGDKFEAIRLFDDDEFADYLVFADTNDNGKSVILIDKKHGKYIDVQFAHLKTLTDIQIINTFYPPQMSVK